MEQNDVSRRDFLKMSALGACGLCLAGCGMRTSAPLKEYWEANKNKLMDNFDSIINPARILSVKNSAARN
jgi:anaerobic selenocysteine-containing dehydrogenase